VLTKTAFINNSYTDISSSSAVAERLLQDMSVFAEILLRTELNVLAILQVPVINALILSNLYTYRQKLYIAENEIFLLYIFVTDIIGLSSTTYM